MPNTPNINIPYVPEGTLDPAAGLNEALNVLDALVQTAVISMDETVPPATGSDGDMYIVGAGATGDWSGEDNNLARYVLEGQTWQFFVAGVDVHQVINLEDGGLYKFIPDSPGANWTLAAGLSDAPSDGDAYGRQDGAWVVIPDVGALAAAEVLTAGDETADFPNSRRVVGGNGVIMEDTTANIRTIRVPQPNKEWFAAGSALALSGANTAIIVGTASTPAKATGGNVIGYMSKRRHTSTTAANNVASFRSNDVSDEVYSGSASSNGAAGLFMRMRFSTAITVAGERFFAGLALNAAEAGTVDPSSLLNCFGVGKDGADSNYHIMHNDGSGAATKVDLGLAFASNKSFDLVLYVPRGGGSWNYILLDLDTGTVYTNTISSNIPANDTALYWRIWGSVGASAGVAIAVDAHYIGIKYPL